MHLTTLQTPWERGGGEKETMNNAQAMNLPFDEAIRFFRQKVNLPTKTWDELWQGMHARAFVSAGAVKSELLADLRGAVDKAIEKGTTLAEFRKDFDALVKRHGWAYKGGRGWRTRVIYETNLRTAYQAGRYRQMTDPDVLAARPWWEYRHGDSIHPRELHLSWDRKVLAADDPWWKTHYPMNGWGCKCKVFALSPRDLARLGKKGPDTAPEDGTYQWTNPRTGEVHTIPKGIDPGFDYNVGDAAWGRKLSEKAMDGWRAQKADAWERLTPGDWQSAGRPETIPKDDPKASMDYEAVSTAEALRPQLTRILKGRERVFSFSAGKFRHDVLVNAETLARHVDPERAKYLPYLPETLEDPFEVWMAFERHKGTGEVVLRQRILKAVKMGKKKGMLVAVNAVGGVMEAWTVVPASSLKYLNNQRQGQLVWARK